MNPFRVHPRKPTTALRPRLEMLEDRSVPSGLSIGDATATEGGSAYRYTDTFVAPDGYGLAAGRQIQIGPDGNVYVASHDTDVVKVFEGGTGQFLGDLGTSGGELDGSWSMIFGPDGRLYVGGRYSHNIVRFDVGTGGYDVFVATEAGGLAIPGHFAFGSDGNLYVTSQFEGDRTQDAVKRYSGATGAYLGDFVTSGSGGLSQAAGIGFGPDSHLYVVTNGTTGGRVVNRYNGQTGAFIDIFVPAGSGGIAHPSQLLFHTDGHLYVGDHVNPKVYRYSATTGAFEDVLTASLGSSASVISVSGMAFAPSGELYVSLGTPTLVAGSSVGRFAPSSMAAFTVTLGASSAGPVTVDYTTVSGSATSGSDFTPTSGTLTFAPGETVKTVLVPTLNDELAEGNETFTLTLSNAVGATIADGTGVGTIADDDTTKFYVVDDASTDRTYRYGALGNVQADTALNSGNTAPRGAASTAAGDRVWVVDANKKVYVYDAAGSLLGSWTAGGLHVQAQVEGITVWGSEVWLVDAKQDRVYRYAGAATRLSSSQNATSSFVLNSGNKDPKDLVTDGTSIWVVNDSSTDTVFKYTLSGSLQGSWTMSGGGGSPTGITLDPTEASQSLWVVDNVSDLVYEYASARGRISGSQSALATFALNPFNTNPQGIADPPAPGVSEPTPFAPDNPNVMFPDAIPTGTTRPETIVRVESDIRPGVWFGFPPVVTGFTGVEYQDRAGGEYERGVRNHAVERALAHNSADAVPTAVPAHDGERSRLADRATDAVLVAGLEADWEPADEFDFDPIDVDFPRG